MNCAGGKSTIVYNAGSIIEGPGCYVEPTIILANSASDTLLNKKPGPVATFLARIYTPRKNCCT